MFTFFPFKYLSLVEFLGELRQPFYSSRKLFRLNLSIDFKFASEFMFENLRSVDYYPYSLLEQL